MNAKAPSVTLLLATGLQCRCPSCRYLVPLALEERTKGQRVKCRHCGEKFLINPDAEIHIP
jgi:DNA-directed RNA polymerase subunit RPC12/RpoP